MARLPLNAAETAPWAPAGSRKDKLAFFWPTPTHPEAQSASPKESQARTVLTRNLSSVQMRSIDWLWRGWIPRGYITLWAGETGAGKSTVLADVAARVTTGAPWPGEDAGQQRPSGRVLWLGSEDGVEEMTVPRLTACGADLTRVTEIQGVIHDGKRNAFSMQDDIQAVGSLLDVARRDGAPFHMLVIDPVTSYLSGGKLKRVDLNDAGQLRTILEPWLKFAQDYELAIVCVTHFAKDTTRAMLHRVLGSQAFAATCRSLCSVVARPDEGQYAKALVQVKVNLPEHPGGSWRFETEKIQVGVDHRNDRPIDATRPKWIELDSLLTPEAMVGKERGPVSEKPVTFGLWLRAFFVTTPPNEGRLVSEVKAAALSEGIVSQSMWDERSREFLDKKNINGTWWCRPKATVA